MALEEQIDHLAQELDRPVVVYDRAMRLIGHSVHSDDEVDERRRGAILSRRTEPRAWELIRASGVHDASGPTVIASDPPHADRIGMAIRHDGVLLGYLVCTAAPEDLPLSPGLQAVVSSGARALGRVLHLREAGDHSRRLLIDAAVRDVVSPEPSDRERGARALLEAGLPHDRHGYLVAAISTQAPPGDSVLPADLRQLERLIEAVTGSGIGVGGSVGSVIGDTAVVVSAASPDPDRMIARMGRALPREAHLGRGEVVGLDGLNLSWQQASLALAGTWGDSERHGTSARWSDLGADALLLRLPLDRLTLSDLPLSAQRLLAAPHGAELVRTVESYLEHGGDAQATAKSLSIHRSTLYYRLDRVRALAGVDVREGPVRHEVQVGLRVARLAGLTP